MINAVIPGSLAQRKIGARIDFAAGLAPRNDAKSGHLFDGLLVDGLLAQVRQSRG
jgi:hypothetical protein